MKVKLRINGEIYYIIAKLKVRGLFGLAKDKRASLADLIARRGQVEAV
jgi:hypothetical protein